MVCENTSWIIETRDKRGLEIAPLVADPFTIIVIWMHPKHWKIYVYYKMFIGGLAAEQEAT